MKPRTKELDSSDVSGPLMRLGLFQCMVRMSFRSTGITHWLRMMEPTSAAACLAAMAIRFRPVGPLVEFHGLRQPCYAAVADILESTQERAAGLLVGADGRWSPAKERRSLTMRRDEC
jgi:N-acyl amino acid synthase of PEP-CTERM/exosortase system